ncbi:MAG: type II toxin-antitoxin system MqsA family antitoxin [Gemmataceae bacterium]|nr:type II toxin-antitoxin system MqsA family antitoxin [Gemmataceae bacterium]
MISKPFPWICHSCRQRTVVPALVDYSVSVEHDGRAYPVHIPSLHTPKCRNCGKLVMTDAVNEEVSNALRKAAGLLTPEQIKRNREALGYTQRQLAGLLGIADATLSRWETGAQIQQRSLDRFMRILFDKPEVRNDLSDDQKMASLGATITAPQPSPMQRN